jgi:hypothetical protein
VLRQFRLFRIRDTPLRSLYRLYEAICAQKPFPLSRETDYFFFQQPGWKLESIPDPKDPDPVRYAILASLVEEMVTLFNLRNGLGIRRGERPGKMAGRYNAKDRAALQAEAARFHESPPPWVAHVPPVDGEINLMRRPNIRSSLFFKKRNIICGSSYVESI